MPQAQAEDTTRAVQAMRKAHRLGLLQGAIVGIGNAPTALIELARLIAEEGVRPALVVGMPVGFVSAAESKDLIASQHEVPWMVIRGRKGGSTLVVAALHALAGPGRGAGRSWRKRGRRADTAMMEKTVRRGTRTGFTTGACSAAAAAAAVQGLVHGAVPDVVDCLLPNGDTVRFAVNDGRCDVSTPDAPATAHAMVIKDAGDDPDCTDKAHLTADVRVLPGEAGVVRLCGGFGVGTVTMAGLGLEVGGPAINPVPRRNIEDNVRAAGAPLLAHAGLEVTISVPQGVEMARKTLNARLGILGGISILGTTGIVKPYSTSAYRASVVQGVQVAATLGHGVVVLTTGGRTEQFAMKERAALPPPALCRWATSCAMRSTKPWPRA